MRVLMVPIVIAGVLVSVGPDEPSEDAMRMAFERRLAAQVRSVLDYAAETGGEAAAQRIRAARTDRFAVRSFQKLDCARTSVEAGHICAFAVEISVFNGAIQRVLTGRFVPGPQGLICDLDDPPPAGA